MPRYDYDVEIDRLSFAVWSGLASDQPERAELGDHLSDDERDASQGNVETILDMLPDEERDVLSAHLAGHSERSGADVLGLAKTTYHDRLKRALAHTAPAARVFYDRSEDLPPEPYRDALDETEPPTTMDDVVALYLELGSVRKVAHSLGMSRSNVQRILAEAA